MISRPNLVSFYLLSLASTVSSSSPSSSANFKRDGWKPPHELDPTIPFILGGAVPAGQGVPLRNDKGPFNYWDDPANSKPSTPSISIPEETTMANTTKLNGLDIDRLLLPEHAPPLHVAPLPKEASTWTWACNPISECEPCPENSIHYPYCRPFGNRKAVHCIGSPPKGSSLESIFLVSHTSKDGVISSLGWEACGKVVRKEAWDYGELVVSTLLISLASILAFSYRQRTLSSRQYEALSRRIDG